MKKTTIKWEDQGTKVQITLPYLEAEVLWRLLEEIESDDGVAEMVRAEVSEILDEYINS